MRRVHVTALARAGDRLVLSAQASHHLLVVCRHPRGQPLVVFDGDGLEADARLVDVQDGIATVRVGPHRATATPPDLRLVIATPKGPAMDRALRMATEIGVTHIYPCLAERTVGRRDRHERWSRIVQSACEQCGRAATPILLPVGRLREALATVPPTHARMIAVPGADAPANGFGPAALAIGPEGGFTAREVDEALSHGWQPIGLGPWTLRADTAVAVGLGGLRMRDS